MPSAHCPDCDEEINLRNPLVGQRLVCPYCDTEIEVISIDPLDLEWAYDDDWGEDDEDWGPTD